MDFGAVIVFLCVYFIRPQDWVPGLAGLTIVKPIMLFAILAMFIRPRGFNLRDLFSTPLDWMVAFFYAYLVWSSEAPFTTLKAAFPLFAFYLVTRQALHTPERIAVFLKVWTICLAVIAGMAVASQAGIDITGAREITERANGRLALNTWMHNNPNALGHSVIVGIPLLYFLMIWRRPFFMRAAAAVLIAMLAFCVFLTESRGAYLAGFATLVAAMMFGRGKVFQIAILAIALTIGVAFLTQLPRMESLSSRRSDEAIVGRLLAWELAREATRNSPYGEGWKTFRPVIDWHGEEIRTATHSSYVKIGADLGYPGIFLYVGILCLCLRIVFQAQTYDDENERIRRMLFTILISYGVSNWMIDRAYHTEFFLMAGAIAAFHAYLLRQTAAAPAAAAPEEEEEEGGHSAAPPLFVPPPPLPGPSVVVGEEILPWRGVGRFSREEMSGAMAKIFAPSSPEKAFGKEEEGETARGGITWRNIGLLDIVVMIAGFRATIWFWDYVIQNF